MNTRPHLFPLLAMLALSGPAGPAAAETPAAETAGPRQEEVLRRAIAAGRAWQESVRAGEADVSTGGWGYQAFRGTAPEALQKSLAAQTARLGKLLYSAVQEDRCLVDMNGGEGPAKGIYVTLRWLSQYEKSWQRDLLVLHEPAQGGQGLKIIGLRREPLPAGRQGGFELAAGLGQLGLLKLHGAPRERWEPYEREVEALAAVLQVTLPAIPEPATSGDKASGGRLVKLIMLDAGPVLEKLGPAGGSGEAQAALNAFALLMLYAPGEETCTRLAALLGGSAEKAGLPGELWKPLVKAVVGKEKLPAVHEAVQNMVAGVSAHLQEKQTAEGIASGAKEILDAAFNNMARLPTYAVRAEMDTADGRRSVMEAALAPGIMDVKLEGFDGRRERRVVDGRGFFLSRDDGKTWEPDPGHETARGLCRTLQSPLDGAARITEKLSFALKGRETLDGEELFRFESGEKAGESPRIYWILMSKAGPVVRRARLFLRFGDLVADTLITYTKLGREVEVADPAAPRETP